MKKLGPLFLTIVFGLSCTNAQEGHERNTITDSIFTNGVWRTFEFHVPQYPINHSRLVFVFHDDHMSTADIQAITGFEFNKIADRTAGTIVVYPQGYQKTWNHSAKKDPGKKELHTVDDLGFIKSIVQRMERRYAIDRKNIFAVGYFKGGNLCYQLAKETPKIFKGFAIIGAKMSINPIPEGIKPVSMFIINDMADATDLNNNSETTLLDYWLNLRGTDKTVKPMVSSIEKSNSEAIRYDYIAKEKDIRTSLLKIVRGGYGFPNPNAKQWPQIGNGAQKQLNLPELVARFFYLLQYNKVSGLGS